MAAAYAYLDHNATSPLRPVALDAMVEALRSGGNPSSVHRPGRAARAHIDKARRQVAGLVGALPGEIVFTSGGTEATFAALLAAQVPDAVKRARADFVIDTGAGLEAARQSVERVIATLVGDRSVS